MGLQQKKQKILNMLQLREKDLMGAGLLRMRPLIQGGRICGCCNQQKSAFCRGGFFQCNSTRLFPEKVTWKLQEDITKFTMNDFSSSLFNPTTVHKSFITCRWLCFIKCRGGRSFHKHLLLHSLWSLNFSEGVTFYKDYVGWSLKGSLWEMSSCSPGIS